MTSTHLGAAQTRILQLFAEHWRGKQLLRRKIADEFGFTHLQVTSILTHLKNRGYIEEREGVWHITGKGLERAA